MSLEQKSGDLIEEFEKYYQDIKGEKYASNATETLRRGLPGFNEGLKRYVEDSPYASSVHMTDVREEISESEHHLGGNFGLSLFADFLDFAGYEEILDDNIPGDRYGLNSDAVNQERNPVDKIIDEIEIKEPIQVEANLAEYVVADFYRENGEYPQRTEIRSEMEERLGYELNDGQVEQRVTRSGRIKPNRTGGGVENSFSFQD